MLDRATTVDTSKSGQQFTSLHGGYLYPYPAYTDGHWVVETPERLSITGRLPVACDAALASTMAKTVCTPFFQQCYSNRRSPLFAQHLEHLKWTWQPANGCHFVPLAPMPKLFEWARGLEADAGALMWVGDTLLAEVQPPSEPQQTAT